MKIASILALVACLFASAALAHGGGTDQYGCHTQRSIGTYHCHR